MPSPNELQQLTDEELLTFLAGTGGEDAFTALYYRYCRPIYQYVYKRLQVAAVTEDIVQDIFISVWKNRDKLDAGTMIGPYLFRAARNRVYDVLRKDTRAGAYMKYAVSFFRDGETSGEESLSARQLEKTIFNFVRHIPDKGKVAFLLCKEQGMSIAEAAERLAISPKTVEWHIAKISRQVRSFLGHTVLISLLYWGLYNIIYFTHVICFTDNGWPFMIP